MLKISPTKSFWLIKYDFDEKIFGEQLTVLVDLMEKCFPSCDLSEGFAV